ncbi:MAG: META domain-containing protein [Muribaculaceae bacterium]|nr:META domain-containing protein [Muribaculaceae bacterium]MDE6753528.1 META domain-containing protein [Muribaculaceae bacterium]
MKKIKKFIIPVLFLAMLPLSSCGVMKKSGGDDVKKETVLPNDREKIVQPVSAVYTSEDLEKGIVKGDWAIEKVNGKEAIGENPPFLKFVPAEKRVYGNNGCNTINATYTYNPADSTLSFSNLVSTMMACGMEGITDVEINAALDAARYYTWKLNGDDYYLTLYDADHSPVMELMHQNFQFLNGTWAVKEIEGQAINIPDMKLVIDVDEGKLHGNTGCNLINGSLETDMDAANSISFQGIAMTKMACPDSEYETPFVVALEEASKAKPLKDNQVALMNGEGKVVLLLERTSDK